MNRKQFVKQLKEYATKYPGLIIDYPKNSITLPDSYAGREREICTDLEQFAHDQGGEWTLFPDLAVHKD